MWLFMEIIGEAIRSTFIRRKQRRGRIRCGLRLDEGIQPGLTSSWRHGYVTLTPALIRFDDTDIHVLSISLPSSDAGPRDRYERNAGAPTFMITTSTARLIWAIPLEQVDWALNRIGDESLDAALRSTSTPDATEPPRSSAVADAG